MRPRLTITSGFMDVIHFKYRRRITANAEPLYFRSFGMQQKIDAFGRFYEKARGLCLTK